MKPNISKNINWSLIGNIFKHFSTLGVSYVTYEHIFIILCLSGEICWKSDKDME